MEVDLIRGSRDLHARPEAASQVQKRDSFNMDMVMTGLPLAPMKVQRIRYSLP